MVKNSSQEKYSRQILIREIGKEGQQILANTKIAIVGLGAVGSVTAELLCRAGVGYLLLVDRDMVEESNLQRQLLYTEEDIGKSKAFAAQERLSKINSSIQVIAEAIHLDTTNLSFLENADLILDCTDNLQTRFVINDFCKKVKQKWVYAAAIKNAGYVCSFSIFLAIS